MQFISTDDQSVHFKMFIILAGTLYNSPSSMMPHSGWSDSGYIF